MTSTEEPELERTRGAQEAPVAADTRCLSTVAPPSEDTFTESVRLKPGDEGDARLAAARSAEPSLGSGTTMVHLVAVCSTTHSS